MAIKPWEFVADMNSDGVFTMGDIVEVTDRHGHSEHIKLDVRYRWMVVRPPIGKQRKYPALTLSVIHARETTRPKGRERMEWKLLTDLPVSSLRLAVEKLDWYALRWKIETFFKILKSGCRAEEAKLRTATRLTNLISIYSIVSWRIFWLCMINRAGGPYTLFARLNSPTLC